MLFCTQAPTALSRVNSGSASSGKSSWYLAANFWCEASVSAETPNTATPAVAKAARWSRKPQASFVQPGVSSFG